MKNTAISTGAITTSQVKALGTRGVVSYAEVTGGTLVLRSGGAGGVVLLTLADADNVALDMPVRYTNGLHATVSAGSATVHIG